MSQIVTLDASPFFHNLCGARLVTECDIARMDADKNGGPNYLREWRLFRKLTQEQLAERVGTNANMIGYLESGERGLSAKWLRRLAPALDTTPGMLLDHDPSQLDSDIIDIWAHAGERERRQISDIAKTLLRTGTDD
jgi:transcriptional regulator with XRE-family HTH domain